MSDNYNLLKHVFLSSETLLNIAEFDVEDADIEKDLEDHRSYTADAPQDLIRTIKFVANNGYFAAEDTIKLLENVNLSEYELFTLMCLALDDRCSYKEASDDNKAISLAGFKHPKFDQDKYTELLGQFLDVFPVKVAREPLCPKHVLLKLIKNKSNNFSAMLSICNHPKIDHDILAHLANEFYSYYQNGYISSHEEKSDVLADELNLEMGSGEAKMMAAIFLAPSNSFAPDHLVHLKLKELDNRTAMYWRNYYGVLAFDD